MSGRFGIAFDQATLDTTPTFTFLDQVHPNLVTSYSIERGRAYELDRTDTGRATVSIADVDGILDPTNPAGPYYGQIEPLLQAKLMRYNPVDETWYHRYRGFVEDLNYVFDPSQQVNRLELTLVDLFEIVSSIEMHPGQFGDPPPTASVGQIFFEDTETPLAHDGMQIRILQVLTDCGIDEVFYVVFSGNVDLHETVYSPGESAMTAIAEAADAEFPGVANVYCDRLGRLCAHGRYARFDPHGTAATTTPDRWNFTEWNIGDGARVTDSPDDTAHVRSFAYNFGLSRVINRALATPVGIADADVQAQIAEDSGSIGQYGIRAWTSQNLIVKTGVVDAATDVEECKLFADYYVANYSTPKRRITECLLRSIHPLAVGAAANWELLSLCDIGDQANIWVGAPGGGGFDGIVDSAFFIEGIREEARPLNALYDDVTLSLDLSPGDYFADSPFAAMP